MKFEEALVELRKGKKITCISLPGSEFSLSDLWEISITLPNGISIFSVIDFIIKGEWFIVEEPGKTFSEVFEAFNEGKKIRRKKWDESFPHSYLDNEYGDLSIHTDDLIANDWEIME